MKILGLGILFLVINCFEIFERYVFMILNFRYEACNRFHNERGFGAKIVVNVFIKKNKTITGLGGQSFYISDEDLKVGVNDFSVFTRSRSQNKHLYLGPAAYVNHDCKSNGVF